MIRFVSSVTALTLDPSRNPWRNRPVPPWPGADFTGLPEAGDGRYRFVPTAVSPGGLAKLTSVICPTVWNVFELPILTDTVPLVAMLMALVPGGMTMGGWMRKPSAVRRLPLGATWRMPLRV